MPIRFAIVLYLYPNEILAYYRASLLFFAQGLEYKYEINPVSVTKTHRGWCVSTMSEDLPYFFISSFFEPMSAPSAKMSKR